MLPLIWQDTAYSMPRINDVIWSVERDSLQESIKTHYRVTSGTLFSKQDVYRPRSLAAAEPNLWR